MRTTIDIRDELLVRAKQTAAAQRRRLSDLVNDALVSILERTAVSEDAPEPFRIHPFDLGPALPGIDLDDSRSLQDAMEKEAGYPRMDAGDLDKFR